MPPDLIRGWAPAFQRVFFATSKFFIVRAGRGIHYAARRDPSIKILKLFDFYISKPKPNRSHSHLFTGL
jgi:hypothetical protein